MSAQRPPNIVVVTCHDLGRHLGCYGGAVHSPHLDAFAADAVRFSRAFCTAPQCSPSRAALYTGRYPHENGVLGLTHANFAWDLHPDERHIGQVLHDAGYRTALVGIHHESRRDTPKRVAARCGFDEFHPPAHGDATSDTALGCLRRFAADGTRPFYLQIGYEEPHRTPATGEHDYMGFRGDHTTPDDPATVVVPPYLRDDHGTRAELAELNGAVRYVDAQIGRVLAGLRDLGLAENTLVVFTPDHGLALPRAKCSLYEPGLEVALIMRWPVRGWLGGRVLDPLVSNVDVFATLVEAAGLPIAANIAGRSLAPLLDGGAYAPRDHVFAEMTYHDYYDPRRSVRTGQWKLIVNFTAAPAFMDPSQSWRPRSTPATPMNQYHPLVELYDLDADPVERTNLADDPAHAETRRDLLTRLHDWLRDTNDPLLAGAVTSPMHTRAVAALADGTYTGNTDFAPNRGM